MLFSIMMYDEPNSAALRDERRAEHLDYLKAFDDQTLFAGPFTTDDWPSRDFRVLLAILRPGDPQRERWLEESGLDLVDSWGLPDEREGRLYQMENGWVTLER